MTMGFVQRQIERLLAEAADALTNADWATVRQRAETVRRLQPDNDDAAQLLQAVERVPAEAPAGSAEPPPAPAFFGGGRYQVVRFLGEGGKKRVYLAHDLRLDRDVAFALIKTDGLDAEGRERVEREAQAMGKLGTHPHIVSVFDMGEEVPATQSPSAAGGAPFLVTELMQGGDIEGLLEKAPDHRLAIRDAVNLAIQVCRGLEFAHAHGLVHRDLKPGNVWLTGALPGGEGIGTAKIGDFGLAIALDRSRLTQAGMMVGTVSYMPPEQATGASVTAQSDLYALGAMLYEMLCGRPPFVGDDSVSIIGQHLNTPPIAPSWHRPDLPAGLEALVLKLLEKEPGKRPGSAGEVREALEGVAGMSRTPQSAVGADPVADGPVVGNPVYRRVFVGREAELHQLHDAFDSAMSGQPSLIMVVGEPGIGKTSVCEQLSTYAALRGGKTLVGHCYEQGSLSLPYLPFVEALRSYVLSREPDGLRQDLGTGAGEVARIVSEVRDRVQVSPGEGGDPEEQRWRLLQAVSGFLRNASHVQPLLLVLEDLHDADRGTLQLLLHLTRSLEGARLLIVGTYRDVEVDRSHPLSGALAELRRAAAFARVPLRGLTVDEVHRMMNLIRGQEVPWSRAEAIHRQTEGNPLFVQEVLRYLVEEGLVVRQGDRYARADGDDPEAGIPEGLRDVIGKRLSRLSEKTNQVLSIGAVIGREFRMDVLQAVAGLPEDEVFSALEEASERAVLEERPGLGGALAFRFTHAFFRQTLYEEIFAARRIRWHQQVARALETVHARRLDEHAAELSEHFAHSSDPQDLQKAVHYGERAAERSMAVYAYGDAVHHLEQALKAQDVLDPDDADRRYRLLMGLGRALMPAGDPGRVVRQVAPAAFRFAEVGGGGEPAAAAALLALEGMQRFHAEAAWTMPDYRRWAQRAADHAPPESLLRVHAANYLARVYQGDGDWTKAQGEMARAADLAQRLGDPAGLVSVGATFWQRACPQLESAAFEVVEQALACSREEVASRDLGLLLWSAGMGYLRRGNRARAIGLWHELEELAARSRDPNIQARVPGASAAIALLNGELEQSARHAALAAHNSPESGVVLLRPGVSTPILRALLYMGRVGEAPETLHTPGTDTPLVLAHAGRIPEAAAELKRRLERYEESLDRAALPGEWAAALLEAAVLLDDGKVAQRLCGYLAASQYRLTYSMVSTDRLLGATAALLGDYEAAGAHYREGLEFCQRIGHRPELALIRLEIAELLHAHYPERETEARAHLDFAIEEFREMKMQPSLERALRQKGMLTA